jgi:cytochrome c
MHSMNKLMIASLLLTMGTWSCSADDQQEPSAEQAFEQQVMLGGDLFAAKCAVCHGLQGQGTADGPRVVGFDQGALPRKPPAAANARDAEFITVADVAAFVVANMPPGQTDTLTLDEYLSILAFDLSANGIQLEEKLTLDLAKSLKMPTD